MMSFPCRHAADKCSAITYEYIKTYQYNFVIFRDLTESRVYEVVVYLLFLNGTWII